jgi:DHA1 family quinolone resistance protein-like MFS transporter
LQFIKDGISGGSIIGVGIAIMLFVIIKSILQLPFSRYIDTHREKVTYLLIGTGITIVVPFIYAFTNAITGIYIAQILRGIGSAMAYPTWLSLFSTHLDKQHEGFEWSLYSTSVGIGIAITGLIGAAIASSIGFFVTFLIAGILSIIGWVILFKLEKREHVIKKVFTIGQKSKLVKTH